VNDVSRYIPHRPPMILIDAIETFTDTSVTTSTHISPASGLFSQIDGGVPAWVGLEYMAQTAAVWVGLDDERCGRAVEPAFLVSSRQYTVPGPVFPAGETLFTLVEVQLQENEIVAFRGRITNNQGELRAEAFFTAYRPHNVRSYLLRGETSHITGAAE